MYSLFYIWLVIYCFFGAEVSSAPFWIGGMHMSQISVNNLTFYYEGSYDNIFENVSFNIDTDWKLGLIGRNGKGKTTFLKLLQGQYEYKGTISKNVEVNYFPFEIKDKDRMAIEIVNEGLRQQAVDLTGCSLRQVLYFVDSGRPVLARLSDDEYALVIGFDAYNALLLDTSGRRYKIGLEDGTELFRSAGNEFLTYEE